MYLPNYNYLPERGQTPGDGEGQGSLACCRLWGHKQSDTTQQLKNDDSGDLWGLRLLLSLAPLMYI